jgi:hypothetical protein
LIKYPKTFAAHPPYGFDGQFHWEWLNGIFPRGIMPMDIDAVIEYCGRFLIFETKDQGIAIPQGQYITLVRLTMALPELHVILLWSKDAPRQYNVIKDGRLVFEVPRDTNTSDMQMRVMLWRRYAERNPGKSSFLIT